MTPIPPAANGVESLADANHRVRDDLALQAPPPNVLAAVQAAWAARPAPALAAPAPQASARRGAFRAAVPRWWAAGAFVAVLMAATSLLLATPAETPRMAQGRGPAPFVAVAAAERWPAADEAPGASPAWLVAAELPRERLAAWGLPFDPARAGDAVRAELLLRPSGEVLAVRLLRPASTGQ